MATTPGSDLSFYKLDYNGQAFLPVTNNTTLCLHTSLGCGNGYGSTDGLPFYESYTAGGQGCGSVDLTQMAVSLGVSVTWYSPMGPLSFSLAAPLKKPDNAETQIFQFSLGQTF